MFALPLMANSAYFEESKPVSVHEEEIVMSLYCILGIRSILLVAIPFSAWLIDYDDFV
jgi:hypothetical protein